MYPATVGTLKPVLIVGETNVLVYCKLISQQFVGDKVLRCLRLFIYPSAYCNYVFKEVFMYLLNNENFKRFGLNF